ncbi:MAG: multiheme c-type cytochrome [Spirochaetia bacterium]|nr:multiheme c-type cytochrome [Spirochaetia bacterium]
MPSKKKKDPFEIKTVSSKKNKFASFINEFIEMFRGTEELSLNMKKVIIAFLSVIFFISLLIVAWIEGGRKRVLQYPDAVVSGINKQCVNCHQDTTPGIVKQWKESKHSHSGIGCYDCHQAKEGDKDLMVHYNGLKISTIVSPNDCSSCHEKQFKEFTNSHHAKAGAIIGSLDNELAEVVEGHVKFDANGNKIKNSAVAVSGCLQCHGSEVKVLADGKLDPDTWPNTGIGRINPDGSKGSCSACHLRHNFSIAQARQPEVCGKCHMGPDHPHIEIYMESKHGISFVANREKYYKDMENLKWIPGVDFESGPTCATCHMGATRDLEITHDVGSRISWNLRPPISEKIDAADKAQKIPSKRWEDRRSEMQDVCSSCHSPSWIENWYTQYDSLIETYNDKFARPATELYNLMRSEHLITSDVTFDDQIEFTYFYLWHHEGRRARHGASMMGPDYTQWHGMFEVADTFYQKFIPQLREVIAKNRAIGGVRAEGAERLNNKLQEILNSPMHQWFIGKQSPQEKAARQKDRTEFKKRYTQ